jgi:hypothetical protein
MNCIQHGLNDLFFEQDGEVARTRRNLPHWNQEGKLYFLTWRLADSLPQQLLAEITADREPRDTDLEMRSRTRSLSFYPGDVQREKDEGVPAHLAIYHDPHSSDT